jgi:uncharacterized protein (TIGR03083 family)
MALSREVITDGLVSQMGHFEDLIRSLTEEEWDTPSRCQGWTVGDVARHAVGSMADVVAGELDGLGSPEVTAREVAERQGRSAKEVADELAEVAKGAAALAAVFDDDSWNGPAPGGYDGTLGRGVEALWYDFWLHADDIRASLGRPSEPEPGLISGVSHVGFELEKRGWTGAPPKDLDAILVATGRAQPTSPDAPINIYAD